MADCTFPKIGIVGSGRMGTDIFYFLNDFPYSLVWFCRNPEKKASFSKKYETKIKRMYKSGAIDESTFQFRTSNTIITDALSDLQDCDLIIESISEDQDAKIALFQELDKIAKAESVFVTNTSSIKPGKLYPNTERRLRFAALHFFYPIPYCSSLEIIATDQCDPTTIAKLQKFSKEIKKNALVLPEEGAFLLNKIFSYFQGQVFRYYKEKILSKKEIDALVRKIFAMGSFEFLDNIGIDIALTATKNYKEEMPYPEFFILPIQEMQKKVDQGDFGMKTGRGFYSYNPEKPEEEEILVSLSPEEKKNYEQDVVDRLSCIYISTCLWAIDKGYCTAPEIEKAMDEYIGMQKGPIKLCQEMGFPRVKSLLSQYYEKTKEDIFGGKAELMEKLLL
ncbi:MAG: hypothetical protein HUU50_12340 [Candidatus Brocadiae bacterium]|nr:hypothetical protein [Candidatus Brocadiia bacterium]